MSVVPVEEISMLSNEDLKKANGSVSRMSTYYKGKEDSTKIYATVRLNLKNIKTEIKKRNESIQS